MSKTKGVKKFFTLKLPELSHGLRIELHAVPDPGGRCHGCAFERSDTSVCVAVKRRAFEVGVSNCYDGFIYKLNHVPKEYVC